MTCNNCVTQLECKERHERVQQCLEEHEERMNKKDIRDARNEGIMEVQTKVLWAIFGIGVASFLVDLFRPELTQAVAEIASIFGKIFG